MKTEVAQQQEQQRIARQKFSSQENRIYAHATSGSSSCVATCETSEDAKALIRLIHELQGPTIGGLDKLEWFERRGNMVYGEDNGPGTAPHIATCKTANDANTMVMILCELAATA